MYEKDFQFEREKLAPLFAAAVKSDRAFRRAWDEQTKSVGVQAHKNSEHYRNNLDKFRHDTRAVLSLIELALVAAKRGDDSKVPIVMAFLDLPGRFFRSGYLRKSIWCYLRRLSFHSHDAAILRHIILAQIETAGPEYHDASKLVPRISNPNFIALVKQYLYSEKQFIVRRAERLLALCDSSPKHTNQRFSKDYGET